MSAFSASNTLAGTQQALTTTFKTLLLICASSGTALRRIRVHDVVFGTDGTPADQAMTWDISRTTANGTATSVTPNPLDGANSAFLGLGVANHTAEPTVTAASSVWAVGVNQRATMRWVPQPGHEIVIPATNLAGLAFRAKSPGYTGTAIAQTHFEEL